MSLKKNSYEVQIITSAQEMTEVQQEWEEFLKNYVTSDNFWQHPKVIQLNIAYRGTGKPFIIILRHNKKIECIAPGVIEYNNFQLNFSVFRIPGPPIRILKIVDSSLVFSQNANIDRCIPQIVEAFYNHKSQNHEM